MTAFHIIRAYTPAVFNAAAAFSSAACFFLLLVGVFS